MKQFTEKFLNSAIQHSFAIEGKQKHVKLQFPSGGCGRVIKNGFSKLLPP